MPTTVSYINSDETREKIELSNEDPDGKIIDMLTRENINKNPGESIIIGTHAFNIKSFKGLFPDNQVDLRWIPLDMASFDEFMADANIDGIFNRVNGSLRFIDKANPKVISDLKQLYARLSGGSGEGQHLHTYNTRSSGHITVTPIEFMASMKKRKRKGNKTKKRRSKKHTKRKKKRKKKQSKSKMR
jgi:hypothetical protein